MDQQFVQTIPWQQQELLYGFLVAIIATFFDFLIERDDYVYICFLLTLYFLYLIDKSKLLMIKYYKQKMQDIISKTSEQHKQALQQDLKVYMGRQRQTTVYFYLLQFSIMLLAISLFLEANNLVQKNNLIICFACLANAIWIFISNKHYNANYVQESQFPPQGYPIQFGLPVLALVMGKYGAERLQSEWDIAQIYIVLFTSAGYTAYTFSRFGRTSKRSFVFVMCSALCLYLHISLNVLLGKVNREMLEINAFSSALYLGSVILQVEGVLLHVKAINDFFQLTLKVRYGH